MARIVMSCGPPTHPYHKEKPLKISSCSFANIQIFCWYLSSNAAFRGFICLQISFSWFYLFSNAVFRGFISSNSVFRGFIRLQTQFFVLLSLFKFSFLADVSSNAVFNASICLQIQYLMLVSVFKFIFFILASVFKCGFPCWCLSSNADFLSVISLHV